MRNQDIVMLCQQGWELAIDCNAKNIARELARQNRVLYVNMPLDINTVLRNRNHPEVRSKIQVLRGLAPGLVQAEPNLWVYTPDVLCLSINWLGSRRVFKLLNMLNSRLLAGSIRRATQAVGFASYYLFLDGIIFQGLELPRLLRPRCFIYYLRDYMLTVPYFRRHGPWAEAQLLRQADVVVANSVYLNDYAHQHNPQHSHYIGQGCVLARYQAHRPYPVPADVAAVPQPIIGYTGLLTTLRLDMNLLLALARRRPAWSLVLVGPEDEHFQQSPLHSLPNVYFLGRKAPEELPAYLSHFDVCINPQAVNEVTVGNYPLKIDEYLAMGKPVVATHTRTMELFQDHVRLARSEDEWIALLETALTGHDDARSQAGIAFAQSHTWTASVEHLYDALDQVGCETEFLPHRPTNALFTSD